MEQLHVCRVERHLDRPVLPADLEGRDCHEERQHAARDVNQINGGPDPNTKEAHSTFYQAGIGSVKQ